jgi:hypothetical protein
VHGYTGSSFVEFAHITLSRCERCANSGVWIDELLVYPMSEPAPMPSEDLSEDVKKDFLEARSIFTQSPRGAAALLRLCVQKLVIELGEPGKDLSTDIGALVKRGLLPRVQKALDAVRVIGNNAVHPGQINLDDTPETAFALFGLVEAINDQLITHPKQVDELYGQAARDGSAGHRGARQQGLVDRPTGIPVGVVAGRSLVAYPHDRPTSILDPDGTPTGGPRHGRTDT